MIPVFIAVTLFPLFVSLFQYYVLPLHGSQYAHNFVCVMPPLHISFNFYPGKFLVQEDAGLYSFINQGCLTVDGMDDQEEMKLADVCIWSHTTFSLPKC